MGMTSATKLREIVKLAELATAIELLVGAQGLEFHAPLAPGRGVKQAYEIVRRHVSPLTQDRAMAGDIEKIKVAILRGEFDLLTTDYTD
jgi:histidine ammonia-lyase